MIKVTPCFNLCGRSEEAMALYEKAFGARTQFILRYADADPKDFDMPVTGCMQNLVYHAEMTIGSQRVMFSDIIEFSPAKGTALFLTVTFEDAEGVRKAYDVLKDGSTTIYPMKSTTYSSCFVSFVDRFGFRWGLMTEQTDK